MHQFQLPVFYFYLTKNLSCNSQSLSFHVTATSYSHSAMNKKSGNHLTCFKVLQYEQTYVSNSYNLV